LIKQPPDASRLTTVATQNGRHFFKPYRLKGGGRKIIVLKMDAIYSEKKK
jgi:hypothetical protein